MRFKLSENKTRKDTVKTPYHQSVQPVEEPDWSDEKTRREFAFQEALKRLQGSNQNYTDKDNTWQHLSHIRRY